MYFCKLANEGRSVEMVNNRKIAERKFRRSLNSKGILSFSQTVNG